MLTCNKVQALYFLYLKNRLRLFPVINDSLIKRATLLIIDYATNLI